MERDDATHEETGFPEIRPAGQHFLTMPIRDGSCASCMKLNRGGSFQLPRAVWIQWVRGLSATLTLIDGER